MYSRGPSASPDVALLRISVWPGSFNYLGPVHIRYCECRICLTSYIIRNVVAGDREVR
jgi:hypothetical protein